MNAGDVVAAVQGQGGELQRGDPALGAALERVRRRPRLSVEPMTSLR